MSERLAMPRGPYAGYHQPRGVAEDAELTHVGPGTPCGEYLRRFWQPVCMSRQLADLPLVLTVMGENLVAFRDKSGRVGLLNRHCSHRGASLEFGIVSDRGIRCCYHGWLFDVDGRILETPAEPPDSPLKDGFVHGAYPTREYKGLVFAYMGPPGSRPDFPVYDSLELPDDELAPYAIHYPCNWLQVNENPVDPYHSVFLHSRVTEAHFDISWGALPVVEWHVKEGGAGVHLTNTRRWKNHLWTRINEWVAPNFAQTPDIYQNPDREKFFVRAGLSKWAVPVDDTNTMIIAWRHFNDDLDLDGKGDRSAIGLNKVDFLGQTGARSYEEGQRIPGDYEAQVGQGPINVHALGNLGYTDTGVALLRRTLREGIRTVGEGGDPPTLAPTAAGHVPTQCGDVIVDVGDMPDDREIQGEIGRAIGRIVVETGNLPYAERRAEIERRVRAHLAER